MNIVEAERISKNYRIGDREISVLADVSLGVKPGEFLVVSGTSGSGKTTLLSLLSGLDKPSAGRIWIDGHDITDSTEDELAPLRNRLFGFVFQSFHLVPSLTALENVKFPAEIQRNKEAEEKAQQLLSRVDMLHRIDSFPHQLSGGEMQRVAICRALINQPKILFADEPTGNLDSTNGKAILDLLLELHKEKHTTLILVTHSLEISQLADRIILLGDGRIKGERHRATADVFN